MSIAFLNRVWEVLQEALGSVEMVRFLQQFDRGNGNYTCNRHQWLEDLTVADVMQQIRQQRQNSSTDL
ncbi:hypothetical protein ACQ4M3_18745 [Leptolyngbya sp. AN03gr2]|uniref:hypothetical protein n=1 Tax=unclassified Leptolyngbya TaxID=2650499 RepID=UPI003D31A0C0